MQPTSEKLELIPRINMLQFSLFSLVEVMLLYMTGTVNVFALKMYSFDRSPNTHSKALQYIEPQTEFGKSLLEEANPNGISAFEEAVFKERDPDLILRKLDALSSEMSTTIDARLQDAMNFLNQADTRPTISEAAKSCGISVSTLRLLAKRDLGLPLATWLVWKKLGRAAKALSKETSLAEAAYAGGFADQAHLCRVMKRLFGITPKTAARIMKWRIRDESIYIPSSL